MLLKYILVVKSASLISEQAVLNEHLAAVSSFSDTLLLLPENLLYKLKAYVCCVARYLGWDTARNTFLYLLAF